MTANKTYMEQIIKKSMKAMFPRSSPMYDDHTSPHHDVTLGQMTTFVLYGFAAFLSIARTLGSLTRKKLKDPNDEECQVTREVTVGDKANGGDIDEAITDTSSKRLPTPSFSTLDAFLKNGVVFGFLMVYFYLCDYIKVFPVEARLYSRDIFLFLLFLFILVACSFTVRSTKDVILSRDQTEEWKGWMQVMFVWYHYFAAQEWYNWIRVYIACYVWLTGFGKRS